MKLYDFDKTIYKKDSTAQFYKFCLKKKPSLARYWFLQLWAFAMYLLGIWSKTKMKEKFYSFLKPLQNVGELVSAFWEREEKISTHGFTSSAAKETSSFPRLPNFSSRLSAASWACA